MPVIKILHVCSFSSEDPVSEVDYIHITSYFFPAMDFTGFAWPV